MITIQTQLHPSVNRHNGKDENFVSSPYKLRIGPRNLVRSIRLLHRQIRDMQKLYGLHGAGESWLVIGRKRIETLELADVLDGLSGTTTSRAKWLLAQIRAGSPAVFHDPGIHSGDAKLLNHP